MVAAMKEEDIIQRVGRNSKALWAVFGVLSMICIFVYRVSAYIYDTKDLPPRVKQTEKDIEKLKPIPDRITSLENRTSALELQLATSVAKIESMLLEVRNDQNVIKTQIVRNGLEHK